MSDSVELALDGLHPVLADDLRRLLGERAAAGSPLSLLEAARLVAQAGRVKAAVEGTAGVDKPAGHLPRQVPFGALVLQTPTIAVDILMAEAATWPGIENAWFNRFMCYLLHYAYDPEALAKVTTRQGAMAAIDPAFCARLTGTEDQMLEAFRVLLHGADPATADDDGTPKTAEKKSPRTGLPSSTASGKPAAAPPGTGSTSSPTATPSRCSKKPTARKRGPRAPTPSRRPP